MNGAGGRGGDRQRGVKQLAVSSGAFCLTVVPAEGSAGRCGGEQGPTAAAAPQAGTEVGAQHLGRSSRRWRFGFRRHATDKQMALQAITASGSYFVSMQMILLCCRARLFTANC